MPSHKYGYSKSLGRYRKKPGPKKHKSKSRRRHSYKKKSKSLRMMGPRFVGDDCYHRTSMKNCSANPNCSWNRKRRSCGAGYGRLRGLLAEGPVMPPM